MNTRFLYGLVITFLCGSCNQPPEIEQVGNYRIADSILDFLKQDFTDYPNFEVYPDQALTFKVTAIDPDGDPIWYSAGPLPMGAEFDGKTGEFYWLPASDGSTAEYDWRKLYVVVEDPHGGWDSIVVGLTLQASAPEPYPTPFDQPSPDDPG